MRNYIFAIIIFFTITAPLISQVRVKDVAHIQGLEETQLLGYGLVVGLDGSGDGHKAMFTVQSIINMLRNLGIFISSDRIRVKNVAAVMVTSDMRPFIKKGSKIDVTVSSIGDARSLEGGTLLMTPLQGADGEVYASAQGPLSVGGYQIEVMRGPSRKKNHSLVGFISDGATVKKEIITNELNSDKMRITLNQPDFTSSLRLAQAIDSLFNDKIAEAEDAATVFVSVPEKFQAGGRLIEFISMVEMLDFVPSIIAKVVINEKVGTIVAGGDVRISEVAVSHGNINIEVTDAKKISQPVAPVTPSQTVVADEQKLAVEEEKTQMVVLPNTITVSDLAKALNSLGVTPRDIISIFQAIKKAGALQAELVIM